MIGGQRKGILMAGGTGSRLYPATAATNKHLLPVYDKPLVYYSLSTLMMANIREVLIITNPADVPAFRKLLGDGSTLGLQLRYAEQASPKGIAQAFEIGRDFLGDSPVCLALGDNLFHGHCLRQTFADASSRGGATIFGYRVEDPKSFGVVELDRDGQVVSLEEKPKMPRSHLAVPGLYFYDNTVVAIASSLLPSARGELEITDVNRAYLSGGQLSCIALGPDVRWLDAGSPSSLIMASAVVQRLCRQGISLGCLEEVAASMGFISYSEMLAVGETLPADYGMHVVQQARNYLLRRECCRGQVTS